VNLLVLADDFGAERMNPAGIWLSSLARRWIARGHTVTVICVRGEAREDQPEWPAGLSVFHPGPDAFDAVLGETLGTNPDAIHIASSGPFGPRVLEILRELPVLLDVHDFWPICPNDDLIHRPRFVMCGEHYPFVGCGACAGLLRLRTMDERGELVASSRLILAHSTEARERLQAGLERTVEMLGYGVDTSRFRPEPAAPQSEAMRALVERHDRGRMLLLGPPTTGRGAGRLIDLLVAVQARVRDVELVVAGNDPENPDWGHVFQSEARELGLEANIALLPRIDEVDLPALYGACQVAIAPGIARETGGMFLLQALASGLPIVGHAGNGNEEWVTSGNEGILIDAHDIPAFAGAVAALLIDPIGRLAFGETSRLTALERHDFERCVFELEDLYRRLTPGQSAAA